MLLSKRGLAFRGHDEVTISLNRGNLMDLIEMFGDEKLKEQLQSKVKYGHYTSHSVQNELISVIATCTREVILSKVCNFGSFTILVDETKGSSKKEQLSFLIRFYDNGLMFMKKH